MVLLWATVPPVSPEERALAGMLGASLGGLLTSRLRHRRWLSLRSLIALLVAAVIAYGISVLGLSDARGVWSFCLGTISGILSVSFRGSRQSQEPSTGKKRGRLIVAAAAAGPLIGLALFGMWWWSDGFNLQGAGFFLAVFTIIGALAGGLCAGLVWLAGAGSDKVEPCHKTGNS